VNLAIFLLQVACIAAAIYGAYRLGKEALVTLAVLLSILANLFVIQQIELVGWNATSSDAFAVGALFSLNLLQKLYGKEVAKKGLWISFFAMLFFVAVSHIHLLYLPSLADTSRAHFDVVLSPTPRLLLASLATFFVVQWFDLYLFALLKRQTATLLISQALDTLLFSFLGLYGLVAELGQIMCVSYVIKCGAIFLNSSLLRSLKAPNEV
jgi:queuosine precursor transporter